MKRVFRKPGRKRIFRKPGRKRIFRNPGNRVFRKPEGTRFQNGVMKHLPGRNLKAGMFCFGQPVSESSGFQAVLRQISAQYAGRFSADFRQFPAEYSGSFPPDFPAGPASEMTQNVVTNLRAI